MPIACIPGFPVVAKMGTKMATSDQDGDKEVHRDQDGDQDATSDQDGTPSTQNSHCRQVIRPKRPLTSALVACMLQPLSFTVRFRLKVPAILC